ncbi:MAG: septation protein IspZ [Hyphomonadaceae bacterium]|nr:septation protein IspZ [Hyphomonadaceae bacterium]
MAAPPSRAVRAGIGSILTDLGPILVFIVAFNVLQRIEATKDNAIFIATGLFMAATVAAIAYYKLNKGSVPPVLIITGVLVLAFGGLTILLRDQTFIQLKPTIVNLFYVAAILGSMAFRQNIWKLLFGHAFDLPDRIWNILALRWCGFFVFMALLNEYIRHNFSFEFWLNTRPLVIFPLFFLFAALNTPLVMKHNREETEPTPPPAS